MNPIDEVKELLQAFQNGYLQRDVSRLDEFMNLFTEDAELIGTNGVKPGAGEWYTQRAGARALVQGDWETWGDLRLDLKTASIQTHATVAWVAATATVSQQIGKENYAAYLRFVKEYLETSQASDEEKLHYILRGGTNTIFELERGRSFVWPLRFSAVVVCQSHTWKFAQIHFSFPTIYFPDVRAISPKEG